MIPTPEQLAFLSSLAPPHPAWQGTGAVRRLPDARDYPAAWHPEVRAALAAGVPDSFDISSSVCEILNQGATGACVAFSTCHGIQVNNNLDNRVCYHFAAGQLYGEMGGTGTNGVDSRGTLQKCEDVGAPTTGGARVRIGSYFWIDQNPATFVAQIKAAISTGKAVVIATLLPTTFAGKWTPGSVSSGYHQLCMTKYAPDGSPNGLFAGPNSWGSEWGNHGFYELSFDYVIANGLLNDYTFAYFFDTLTITPPVPTPTPPVPVPVPTPGGVTVAGRISGTGTGLLAVGQSYRIQAQGLDAALTLTQIQGGPAPVPPPPPPGDLVVSVVSGAHHLLSATVRDQTGAYVAATCIATTAAGQVLGGRQTTPAGATAIPAVWITTGMPPGTAVTVSATTGGERTGTGQGTTS